MTEHEMEQALKPDEARIAELHVRAMVGEELTPAERAALDEARGQAGVSALLAELERADAAMQAACRVAQPSANLAARVMAALPAPEASKASPDVSKDSTLAPSPVRDHASGVMKVYRDERSWRRGPVLAAAAAAAVVALTAGLAWFGAGWLREDQARFEVLSEGDAILDADGQPARELQPGRAYQVSASSEAVLRTGQESRMRLLERTRFEPVADPRSAGVNLKEGLVFAYEPGKDAKQLVVKCAALDAKVSGVAMVFQDKEAAPGGAEGSSVVVVFKGSADVTEPAASQPTTLKAGEMLISDLERAEVRTFLETVESRVKGLKRTAEGATTLDEQHALYASRVADYESQLKDLDAKLSGAGGDELAEMTERRERIARYLEAHRQRLRQIELDRQGEAPERRAQRLERAAGAVREGQEAYREPETWTAGR
ncbi:MAG: hypothetical protein M5U26_08005 [Planctomycetota bacterium]|nr:hypothetical protein [Planctomycetota bacterium]